MTPMFGSSLDPHVLCCDDSDEWKYVFQLIDLLEDRSGASVVPMAYNRTLVGFALCANEKIISMVEYEQGDCISDLIDVLGYLFFFIVGKNEAEA
jgi:hypothetical protein